MGTPAKGLVVYTGGPSRTCLVPRRHGRRRRYDHSDDNRVYGRRLQLCVAIVWRRWLLAARRCGGVCGGWIWRRRRLRWLRRPAAAAAGPELVKAPSRRGRKTMIGPLVAQWWRWNGTRQGTADVAARDAGTVLQFGIRETVVQGGAVVDR